MCLTLPAKVLEKRGQQARVLFAGRESLVSIGTSEPLAVGDYVLTTGDYLVKKINSAEAKEISELLKSYPRAEWTGLKPELREVLKRAGQGGLTAKDLEFLLDLHEAADLEALYAEANITRKTNIKDHICVHGIIEFSNYCKNNCHYCGLRKSNPGVKRYRMEPKEIVAVAASAVNEKGYKILVLQSGEDDYFTAARLGWIISAIKKQAKCFIYLSLGDRRCEDYQKLKEAGANGVLYRFETSNAELFAALRPGKKLADRLDNLRMMKELGYVISTGMIIGLPGQTLSDLANDILLMKELNTFMPSMGPLLPAQQTPLAATKTIDFDLLLKTVAATRLCLKKARLPVTTAMETLGGGEAARQKCFIAGANSVMFNLTPATYRASYNLYDNKFFDAEKRYEKWALFKGELSYQMLEEEIGMKI